MSDNKVFNEKEVKMEIVEELSSTTEEETYLEEETVVKYDKAPNGVLKLFSTLFFRQPVAQMLKGRRGNLRIKDMKPLPRTLELEEYEKHLKRLWLEEEKSRHPSLFLAVFKKEWKSMLLCYATVVLYELFSLAFPLMSQFIIKWLNNPESSNAYGALWIVLSLVFQSIVTLAGEFGKKWLFVMSLRVRNGLIGLIYDKALKLNAAGISEPGKLVNMMSNDSTVFVGNLEMCMFGLGSPPMFGVLFLLIGIYMGKWVFVPLVVFVFFLFVNFGFGVLYGFFYNKFIYSKDKRLSFINEVLKNIKFVKYNGWEKAMEKKTKKYRFWELVNLLFVGISRGSFFSFTIEIGATMAIVLFVAMVFTEQTFQLANVITTISLFNSIRVPVRTVGLLATCSSTINVSFGRIMEFLLTPELQTVEVSNSTSENAIEMSNVKHTFPNGETAFECENLEIKKGELVCVLGSVGSGKSSFLLSLLNELEKTKGESVMDGKVTYASQAPWLMNVSVRDNICFLNGFDKEKYKQTVNSVCLASDIDSLIGGDSYVVAEKGANLSGGQRQRIALARTLYGSKDIVLLDDPLSAVDFSVGNYIFENAIQKLLSGKTRIVVTNQTYFIQKADRILVIEDNKLAFNGTLDELKNSKLDASNMIKTLSNNGGKQEDEKEEIISGDAFNTKIKEEIRDIGGLSPKVYGNYILAGSIFLFLAMVIFISGRITSLYFYNTFLTQWGRSLSPGLNMPQGNRIAFNDFCYSFVADFVAVYLCEISIILFSLTVSKNMHKNMLHNILTTKLGFFDITPIGRIQNLFTRDFHCIDYALPYYIEPIISNISTIIITFITICKASIYLVIMVLVLVAIFVALYVFTSKAVIELQRLDNITRGPIFVHYDQTLLGLATVRTSNAQEDFKEKLASKIKNNTIAFYTSKMARYWFLQRMDWIGALITVATVVVIVANKINGFMDASIAGTALTNITNIPTSISNFSMSVIEIETYMQSTERVLKINSLKKEESEHVKENYKTPSSSWPKSGKIEFDNFSFKYRRGLPVVLNGVSATINDKEKVGVVGRTGSGKSTLMAGLFRIEEALSGKIQVDGVDISTIPLKKLRKKMCILPQESTLFGGTVRDNLDPEGKVGDTKMREVLSLVNSQCDLDDLVAEGGENYSQGQRQLICMARALLKGSKILIMDEATANIDIQTDKTIQETVKKNFEGITVITIAHRLQTIMDADRVVVFEKGKLVENGTPSKLIKTEKTRFNKLVQQSGCAEELRKMAKKKPIFSKSSSTQTPLNSQSKDSSEQTQNKTEVVVDFLKTSSTRASPIVFQETVDRECIEQKLLSSKNGEVGSLVSSQSSSDLEL